jgi:uncharacterized protein (DUF952 family)
MIFHIVKEKDYRSRNDGNRYLPSNFDGNGFVHCALELSVIQVANEYYANVVENVLLLRIDPSKLTSQTKYEPASPEKGIGTLHTTSSLVFPHVYGPIENSAIEGIGVLRKGESGYDWPKEYYSVDVFFGGEKEITA